MHLHDGAVHVDGLLHVGPTNGDVVVLTKSVFAVPLGYGGFSDPTVTQENDFGVDYCLGLYDVVVMHWFMFFWFRVVVAHSKAFAILRFFRS